MFTRRSRLTFSASVLGSLLVSACLPLPSGAYDRLERRVLDGAILPFNC